MLTYTLTLDPAWIPVPPEAHPAATSTTTNALTTPPHLAIVEFPVIWPINPTIVAQTEP